MGQYFEEVYTDMALWVATLEESRLSSLYPCMTVDNDDVAQLMIASLLDDTKL